MTAAWAMVAAAGVLCLVTVLASLLGIRVTGGYADRVVHHATTAEANAVRAEVAEGRTRAAATVALTAIGVPDVDAVLRDRRVDVSERIRHDLVVAGATAQRINATAAARAKPTPPPSPRDDTWVKPDTWARPDTWVKPDRAPVRSHPTRPTPNSRTAPGSDPPTPFQRTPRRSR